MSLCICASVVAFFICSNVVNKRTPKYNFFTITLIRYEIRVSLLGCASNGIVEP